MKSLWNKILRKMEDNFFDLVVLGVVVFWGLLLTTCVAQAAEDFDVEVIDFCDIDPDNPPPGCGGPRWTLIYEYLEDGVWISRIFPGDYHRYSDCMGWGRTAMKQRYHKFTRIECVITEESD